LLAKSCYGAGVGHFGEKISVEQAAATVGMSRNSFARVFKMVAGMTWVDYLNHVRLTEGARFLKETVVSAISTVVGGLVGFCSPFFRVFPDVSGMDLKMRDTL